MLTSPVLVLNKFYIPVSVTSVKRAFVLLYCGAAKAVSQDYETYDFESWSEVSAAKDDECIKTVNNFIKTPRVILLVRYEGFHKKQPKFNRINIFRRDGGICQYCANQFPRSDLTIDHVIPRSKGGKSTWDNVVCCCAKCNRRKGGRTPKESRMRLLNKPKKPAWNPFSNIYIRAIKYKEWEPFLNLVDVSYWNVELYE